MVSWVWETLCSTESVKSRWRKKKQWATGLHLESTKNQITVCSSKGFFYNGSSSGLYRPNLSHTCWWQPAEEDVEKENPYFLCSCLTLTGKFICCVPFASLMPAKVNHQQFSRASLGLYKLYIYINYINHIYICIYICEISSVSLA